MKDKFQIGDLVRLPSSSWALHNCLGLIVSKVPDGIEGYYEYKVLFDNTITTWYEQSLEKVESKENKE